MPPRTAHAVYTPTASFMRGGHFYRYDSMHHTEQARRIDKKHWGITTNEYHEHTFYLLCLMTLALPLTEHGMSDFYSMKAADFNTIAAIHKTALAGLILQVLDPKTYEPQWGSKKKSITQKIMTTVLYKDAKALAESWVTEYFGSLTDVKQCLESGDFAERIMVDMEDSE